MAVAVGRAVGASKRKVEGPSSVLFLCLHWRNSDTWRGLEGSQEGPNLKRCETGQGLWCLGFLEEVSVSVMFGVPLSKYKCESQISVCTPESPHWLVCVCVSI